MSEMHSKVHRRTGLIQRHPGIFAGEPTIAGTRIPVATIVMMDRFERGNVDGLLEAFPTITREQVAAALAFYADNRAEIDRYIAEDRDSALAD